LHAFQHLQCGNIHMDSVYHIVSWQLYHDQHLNT
jgi:hypothetical protein